MKNENPFLADEHRAELAENRKFSELLHTYDGSLCDLPEISTAEFWEYKSTVMLKTFREKEIRIRYCTDYIDKGKTLLDWGIGGGEVFESFPPAERSNYTGIDIAVSFINKMRDMNAGGNFEVMNLMDVEDSSFEQMCALEVIEHIGAVKLPKILLKINRILKSNGHLIISVPLYEQLRFMTISCPHCSSLANKEGHCRSYTPELIKAELKLAGFEVVSCKYVWPSNDSAVKRLVKFGMRLFGFLRPVNIVIKAKKVSDSPDFQIYSD